jgi:hypothetical protein
MKATARWPVQQPDSLTRLKVAREFHRTYDRLRNASFYLCYRIESVQTLPGWTIWHTANDIPNIIRLRDFVNAFDALEAWRQIKAGASPDDIRRMQFGRRKSRSVRIDSVDDIQLVSRGRMSRARMQRMLGTRRTY